MKIFSLFLILVGLVVLGSVKAQELDLECQRRKLVNPNINCVTGGLNEPNEDLDETRRFLFFESRYDGNIDNIPELIRMGFIAFFILVAIVLLFLGIRGMYLYSTAQEDDEKIQTAQQIFKNALIGLVIVLFAIVIVQVVASVFGVADGMFDFSFDVSNRRQDASSYTTINTSGACSAFCTVPQARIIANEYTNGFGSELSINSATLVTRGGGLTCRVDASYRGQNYIIMQDLSDANGRCSTSGNPFQAENLD